MHFGKIQKYAPEVLHTNGPSQLPWNSAQDLASTIRGLGRSDLLKTWDNVVAGKKRSRVVTHVYGSTFPFVEGEHSRGQNRRRVVSLKSLDDIKLKRQELVQYSKTMKNRRLPGLFLEKKGIVAAGLVGAGMLLYALKTNGRETGTGSKSMTK